MNNNEEYEAFQIDLSEYGMGKTKLVVAPDLHRCFIMDCGNCYTEKGLMNPGEIGNIVSEFLSSKYNKEIKATCYCVNPVSTDGNLYAFCDLIEK